MKKPKKRQRKKPLAQTEVLRRIDQMILLIPPQVEMAIQTGASWRASRKIMREEVEKALPAFVEFEGSRCWGDTQQGLSLFLALTVAKLFENPRRNADIASIPLVVRYLQMKRCQDALALRARGWPGLMGADLNEDMCRRSISNAIEAYKNLRRKKSGQLAMAHLIRFRNDALAHTLMDKLLNRMPKYEELFTLLDVAQDVSYYALAAITGKDRRWENLVQSCTAGAEAFWSPAIKAAIVENRLPALGSASSG